VVVAAGRTPRADASMLSMLSMDDNEKYFFESLKVGARGYGLTSTADRDLVQACRAAAAAIPSSTPVRCPHSSRTTCAESARANPIPDRILTIGVERW
jgi:DNA-binding NarL/FixJ family response regulator